MTIHLCRAALLLASLVMATALLWRGKVSWACIVIVGVIVGLWVDRSQ
ncbi:hypothetical protein [Burkholderia multivorans]|nr:hypothetical protein [Burkholderia multivorans]